MGEEKIVGLLLFLLVDWLAFCLFFVVVIVVIASLSP